ncbi:MAG TPA: DUF2953 domain-containing protein [Burkholderiaceae bacterium]|nr:DUF2953 domain-containing protein [Burkholderiaceae bacterium]
MAAALIIGACLLALVLLLAVPVDLAFRFQRVDTFNGQMTIRWLFGLVRFCIRVPRRERAPRSESATEPAKTRQKSAQSGPGSRRVLAMLRQAPFRRRVYRLIKDLVAAAHVQRLAVRMRLGLGDPADTGFLWALVGPLSAVARNLRNADVQIEPEFMHPALELDAQGRLLLIPLQALALAIGFLLSPASIRAWLTLGGSRA